MPSKPETSSDLLHGKTEPRISFYVEADGAVMLKVSGRVETQPGITWSSDQGEVTLAFDLDELDFTIKSDAQGDPRVEITLPRAVVFYLWGNIDRALIEDLRRMEVSGIPSARLREVRDALDVEDMPDGK